MYKNIFIYIYNIELKYTFVPSYNLFNYNFYNNINILRQDPFLNSNLIQYKITILFIFETY